MNVLNMFDDQISRNGAALFMRVSRVTVEKQSCFLPLQLSLEEYQKRNQQIKGENIIKNLPTLYSSHHSPAYLRSQTEKYEYLKFSCLEPAISAKGFWCMWSGSPRSRPGRDDGWYLISQMYLGVFLEGTALLSSYWRPLASCGRSRSGFAGPVC